MNKGGEGIKPGTNGTEPEVIVAQYRRGHRICYARLINGQRADLASMKMGQAPSKQLRAIPSKWNILAMYLESLSGIADPSLTSEESVMSLPSLALDSAVASGVNASVAHPGTARQWYRVLYSLHIRNKHHQRASDSMSTSSELSQLLAHPGDVLPIYSQI